jgi:hypothetical protein
LRAAFDELTDMDAEAFAGRAERELLAASEEALEVITVSARSDQRPQIESN